MLYYVQYKANNKIRLYKILFYIWFNLNRSNLLCISFLCKWYSILFSSSSTADLVKTRVSCFNMEYTFKPYTGIIFTCLIPSVAMVIFLGMISELKNQFILLYLYQIYILNRLINSHIAFIYVRKFTCRQSELKVPSFYF